MRGAYAAPPLDYPNILTIYDIGEFEEIRFIAAEYVKREKIRQRLKTAPISVDDALGEAFRSLGFSRLLYDWNFAEAEKNFKKSSSLLLITRTRTTITVFI